MAWRPCAANEVDAIRIPGEKVERRACRVSRQLLARRSDRRGERGFYTVIAAITLPLLLAAFGLTIDAARARWVRSHLQNAADAAAFAGSKDLNGTASGRASATTAAAFYAKQYKVDGSNLTADEITYNETGRWDFASNTFTATGVSDPAANAIRIRVRRQSVPTLVGRLFSGAAASLDLSASAVAVAGGTGATGCAAPFVIGACVIQHDSDGSMVCPTSLSFQNDLNSIGLTLPDGSSPANGNKAHPYFVDLINDATGCGHGASVGDTLYLQNGDDLKQSTVDLINGATKDGANPVAVSVAVVDLACGKNGPTYNQTAKVSGFVRMDLVGARWTGAAPALVEQACPGIGAKNICVSSNCGPIDAPSGGTADVRQENVYLVR